MTLWIGVVSDTHGWLSPQILDVFDGLHYIVHCGNIGSPEVLNELSQIAPVVGVVSQTDDAELYPFEKTLFRKWLEVGVFVSHRIGDPARPHRAVRAQLEQQDPQVVLFGQSQKPFNNRIDSRLFFNPGPAGRKRSRVQRSVGLLEVEGHSVRGEVVPLDGR